MQGRADSINGALYIDDDLVPGEANDCWNMMRGHSARALRTACNPRSLSLKVQVEDIARSASKENRQFKVIGPSWRPGDYGQMTVPTLLTIRAPSPEDINYMEKAVKVRKAEGTNSAGP